jgi:hypothetical protein
MWKSCFWIRLRNNFNLIIRNDASFHFFLAYQAGRPMTDDGSTSYASVYHTLSRFLPFTGAIADMHKL